MSTFLVTACGHSGTAWLARELGKAPGWVVEHEPNEAIGYENVAQRFRLAEYAVEKGVADAPHYGEVNSYLLASARRINAHRRAVLLRDPYLIAASIARSVCPTCAVTYVRESIAQLDALVKCDDFLPLNLRELAGDKRNVWDAGKLLGVKSIDLSAVDLTPFNQHPGPEIELPLGSWAEREFSAFKEEYVL